jgi:hypothetical protein
VRRAGALGLLALAAVACVTAPPTVGESPPRLPDDVAETAYNAVLRRYSDRAEVYSGFDTRLFSAATFQSGPFREARVRRLAAFKLLPAPEVEALLREERAQAAQTHEFALGVHVNERLYDDFDQPRTIWRIALVTGTAEVVPLEVRRVGRANLDLRAIYPYLGAFWTLYRVRFPTTLPDGSPVITPDTGEVLLRVTSSLGRTDLRMQAR